MPFDSEKARAQLHRCAYVVRNIAYHRALSTYKGTFSQNFWIYVNNNFLDMAVLEWTKIFGSRAEPTHWSAVVPDEDSFRSAMLTELHMTLDQWSAYWEDMKDYRDLEIAHHTKDPKLDKIPHLDTALSSTVFLYDHLIEALKNCPEPVYFSPVKLSRYYQRLLTHAKDVATAAYDASRGIEDTVR